MRSKKESLEILKAEGIIIKNQNEYTEEELDEWVENLD